MFSFLTRDGQRQRELTQAALEEAKKIDATTDLDPDRKAKLLEEAKQTLLKIASDLATNSKATSCSASLTLWALGSR